MKTTSWKRIVLVLPLVIFAVILLVPLMHHESPIELGLDLEGGVLVTYRPDFESRLDSFADHNEEELLALAKQIIESRLYRNLNTVPQVVVRSDQRIVVSLSGRQEYRRILDIVGRTYHLNLRLVDAVHAADAPKEQCFAFEGRCLELAQPLFSGDMLDERSIQVDTGQSPGLDLRDLGPAVIFGFKPPHDQAFAEFTGANVGRQLAILLDDEVEWVGTIESRIEGSGELRGAYTLEEATAIATMLRSGTLPISLDLESVTAVGPSLGQEVRDLGWQALLISLGALALLLVLAYLHRGRLLLTGLLSLGCLLLAMAGLAGLLDLTLDLAGIAGLILSVGMGMDAFLIVFESLASRRQDPEQPTGRGNTLVRRLYSLGGVGRTLFHANATTLVVILLLLFTERLRSFALFIIVGIAASVLTIFLTRALLQRGGSMAAGKGPDLLGWLRTFDLGLFRLRWLYFGLFGVALVAMILVQVSGVPAGHGVELGADFEPGTQLVISASQKDSLDSAVDDLRQRLDGIDVRQQRLGDGDRERRLVTLGAELAGSAAAETGIGPEQLAQIFTTHSVQLDSLYSIDERVSSSRLLSSLGILVMSFICLALYFGCQGVIERLFFAGRRAVAALSTRMLVFCGVLVAVVADIIVVLMVLAGLGIAVGLPVVAALLTIIGYSVNDSVVLWTHVQNRWADYRSRDESPSPLFVVSESVDRVLSRAVLTSLSTMVPALVILVLGLDALRDFAWVMIAGTVAGTLSSLFCVGSFAVRALEREQEASSRVAAARSSAATRALVVESM